jgi:uncharacterized protein
MRGVFHMTNLTFNVAQLLRESIGARRDYTFTEARLPLDDTLVLREIDGSVRFTRTATGIVAHVEVQGMVQLTCVRSLQEFDFRIDLAITDEMHSVVDVVTGHVLPRPTEEDPFYLTEHHMADIGEIIREYTLLELPINPVCDDYRDHPVSYSVESDVFEDESSEESGIDKRLEILKTWTQQ